MDRTDASALFHGSQHGDLDVLEPIRRSCDAIPFRDQGGWLYLVPASGSNREPPSLGLFDTAQWASAAPVTPIARVPVAADDFPYRDRVLSHGEDERMASTVLRAIGSGR